MSILAFEERNNAQLMEACAALGYLRGVILDMTYGLGAFWRTVKPAGLIACDLYPYSDKVIRADARALPFDDCSVDCAVFDPPYKLNGTSYGYGPSAADERYGVDGPYAPARDRHSLLLDGVSEALRVARAFVLVKCQDQISSGKYNAQTFLVWKHATEQRANLVDLIHVPGLREQPEGTRQLHARRNYSSLLVFKPS